MPTVAPLHRPANRVAQVDFSDLGLSSRVGSICNGATVEISWRSRFNYNSLQVDLKLIV